jgi:hypothetical protein
MLHRLVLALAVAVLAVPGAALAAKPKPPKGYAVGQACSTKKETTYRAHHFTCVNGYLQAKK